MALRKQVRVLQVELVQAQMSGLAGFGFGGRGMSAGGDGDGVGERPSGKTARAAVEEASELRRYGTTAGISRSSM